MKHSIANYPAGFLGYVVSPTKICIQFNDVQSKLRFKQGAEYIKLPDTNKALPIKTTGTDIDILAVGCQMPVLEAMQRSLIDALLEYREKYGEHYKATYGASFDDFLLDISTKLINATKGGDDACQ